MLLFRKLSKMSVLSIIILVVLVLLLVLMFAAPQVVNQRFVNVVFIILFGLILFADKLK